MWGALLSQATASEVAASSRQPTEYGLLGLTVDCFILAVDCLQPHQQPLACLPNQLSYRSQMTSTCMESRQSDVCKFDPPACQALRGDLRLTWQRCQPVWHMFSCCLTHLHQTCRPRCAVPCCVG